MSAELSLIIMTSRGLCGCSKGQTGLFCIDNPPSTRKISVSFCTTGDPAEPFHGFGYMEYNSWFPFRRPASRAGAKLGNIFSMAEVWAEVRLLEFTQSSSNRFELVPKTCPRLSKFWIHIPGMVGLPFVIDVPRYFVRVKAATPGSQLPNSYG